MADIIVTEFMDEGAVDSLRSGFEVFYDADLVDRPDELLASIGEARALIVRNRTQVRGALLRRATKLVTVGRLGVGLDNIDLQDCRAREIAVHPATGANDQAVAEYVVGSAMMLMRGVYFANEKMVAGEWPRSALMGHELAGKTIGLVGLGSIAREVARRVRALGMKVIAADPFVAKGESAWEGIGYRTLKQLIAEADIVSLHVPLTDGTRHLIDESALAAMKSSIIIINAARGGIVDDAALASALKDGRIGGAALDVFENEPLTAERGRLFADLPNLLLTPHIAGVTKESNVRVSALVAQKIRESLGAIG